MPPNDPAWTRRYSLPFEGQIVGRPRISPYAELDRTVVIDSGDVTIGAAYLTQCVVVGPVIIEDNVKATAAILGLHADETAEGLQASIGFGCEIEAHADIQGQLGQGVIVRRGAKVEANALVGDGVELMDRCFIGADAEIGNGAKIGVGATIGEHAFVHDGAVVPPNANIPAGGYWKGTESRMEDTDYVTLTVVDPEDMEPEAHVWQEDEFDEWGERHMVKGRPQLYLPEFNPGSSRSWVLAKLARVAVLRGLDKPLNKADVRKHRPELLDHPVTKEMLRMRPPPTAEELNELSYNAIGETVYDVYTGIRFNAGDTPGWQMLTEDTNDVFVLGMPESVFEKAVEEIDDEFGWFETVTEKDYEGEPHEVTKEYFVDAEAARDALFPRVEWHPDRDVPLPIGWVRTILYPRRALVIVEVQTDRPWMKFDWHPVHLSMPDRYDDREDRAEQGQLLWRLANKMREMYFEHFAADAINIVVEWAFTNRYQEVLILDRKSRAKLGGKPPKDYYETIPKKYTLSGPQPLPSFVKLYPWVAEKGPINARRIRPNPSE
jgi:carbonic anhydrase/acetyltransferase-like protein (isoleucine patch superfamily)